MKEIQKSSNNKIKILQTELPEFAFNLLQERTDYDAMYSLELKDLSTELLDIFSDALKNLFENEFISMNIVQKAGEIQISDNFQGYSFKIRKKISNNQTTQIIFYQLKPQLIPRTLDLITLAICLFSFIPISIIPTIKTLNGLLKSIVNVDRNKGDGDLIDVYEAFLKTLYNLTSKRAKSNSTAREIKNLLPTWTNSRFIHSLTALQNRNILKPIKPFKSKSDLDTLWSQVW